MNTTVFNPIKLGGIPLKNRIIRSATHEGWGDDEGYPTEFMAKKYEQLAKGTIGAIITGYAGVQQCGKASYYHMNMIHEDEVIPVYKKLVDIVHKHQTPIIIQIAHCGRQTRSKTTGLPTVAPSAIKDKFFNEETPVELSPEAIESIISDFVKAIVRAKKAGFDGAQIHLAHGYLLSAFLSSYTNRRKDMWGGSLENRFRIVAEILQRARKTVGNYPIWAKINGYDNRPNGMRLAEAIKICQLLESNGCNAVEVSCGIVEDGLLSARNATPPTDGVFKFNFKFKNLPALVKFVMRPLANAMLKPYKELHNYNVSTAQSIKKNISIPVIVVGGIHNLDSIKAILENNKADAVSMSRPFIMEPNLVSKLKDGKQAEARCKYCDLCMMAIEAEPLRCYNGSIK